MITTIAPKRCYLLVMVYYATDLLRDKFLKVHHNEEKVDEFFGNLFEILDVNVLNTML